MSLNHLLCRGKKEPAGRSSRSLTRIHRPPVSDALATAEKIRLFNYDAVVELLLLSVWSKKNIIVWFYFVGRKTDYERSLATSYK